MTIAPLNLMRHFRDERQTKKAGLSGLATTLLVAAGALAITIFWIVVLFFGLPVLVHYLPG